MCILDQSSTTSKKKKKKKNKNASANGTSDKSSSNTATQGVGNNYGNVDSARIVHNPATNMVTIRNPAFGPPPPKMDMSLQQQTAIIKVQENGMVTIRSPALQQAINLGMQPPPKPDFVVKTPNVSEPQRVRLFTNNFYADYSIQNI